MSTVAYLRRSSAPNTATRTVSFEMQESAIREMAGRHGDTIDALITDWAISGGTAKRPGYRQLLDGVDAGSTTTIYSYSLSRLSRSLLDFADLLERCRSRQVRIRLVQEGDIDWQSATGRAFAGMAAVFAQMERELAQERIQSAVDARRARGDHLGQAPYGYRVQAGRLVRREDEDPDLILAAFREGASFGRAARLLNERGVPTRRQGTAWNHGTVADIIRQHFPSEAPLAHSRARARPRSTRILAGLLRCGSCPAILTPREYRGLLTYYCSRSYRVPSHGKTTVREAEVLAWVKSEFDRLQVPDRVVTEAAHAAELGQLERRFEKVSRQHEMGVLGEAELAQRASEIRAAMETLQAAEVVMEIPQAIDWDADPPGAINRVLRALWEYVALGPDLRPVKAEWRVPEWRSDD